MSWSSFFFICLFFLERCNCGNEEESISLYQLTYDELREDLYLHRYLVPSMLFLKYALNKGKYGKFKVSGWPRSPLYFPKISSEETQIPKSKGTCIAIIYLLKNIGNNWISSVIPSGLARVSAGDNQPSDVLAEETLLVLQPFWLTGSSQ